MRSDYPTKRPTDADYLDPDDADTPSDLLDPPRVDVHDNAHTLSWADRERYAVTGCRSTVMVASGYHWLPYGPVSADDVRFPWDDALGRRGRIQRGHFFETGLALGSTPASASGTPRRCWTRWASTATRGGRRGRRDGDHPVAAASAWDLDGQRAVVGAQMELARDHGLPGVLHAPNRSGNGGRTYRTAPGVHGYEKNASLAQEPTIGTENAALEPVEIDVELATTIERPTTGSWPPAPIRTTPLPHGEHGPLCELHPRAPVADRRHGRRRPRVAAGTTSGRSPGHESPVGRSRTRRLPGQSRHRRGEVGSRGDDERTGDASASTAIPSIGRQGLIAASGDECGNQFLFPKRLTLRYRTRSDMSKQTTPSDLLQETAIVDADVHLSGGVTSEEMAERLEEPYAGRLRSSYSYPASTGSDWDPRMGGKIETRTLETPEAVRENLLEEFHVDYPLLNTISGCARIPNTDLAVAMMRATNDVILEKFLDPTDFRALASIAPQRPDLAAEELDRLGDEDQFVGVFVESFAQDPPLGDPHYDPLYEAAEDNDLQIALHGAAATGFHRDFPQQNSGLEEFLSVHTLAHPWQQSLAFTSLLVQGVPEKFPDLNFTFLEAGIAWVPYMTWRLNKEYSFRRSEAPLLEKSPEEYVRDQFYFASQPLGEPNDPEQMRRMIDIVGADSLMFASDYPHWDFDHPSELGTYLRTMFTEEERRQVLFETPKEAFGLDV